MPIYHIHHIIPRHMGGTDDPSNLIKLSIEEHAEAHRLLFEQHGHWQDEIAWKALSGQIDMSEVNRLKIQNSSKGKNNRWYGIGPMRGKKHREETKDKIKKARANQIIIHSDETKKKIGLKHKGKKLPEHVKQSVIESNQRRAGSKHNTHKNKGQKQKILVCPHCMKEGGTTMYRWHFNNCRNKVTND
jgi:hypothetical protein